jgi:hypothetical protein
MSLGFGLKRTYFSTLQMGFAVTDAATGLKLIEAGVPKETLAMLAVPMIPLQITLPWIVSRYASGTDGGMFKHIHQDFKPQMDVICLEIIFI